MRAGVGRFKNFVNCVWATCVRPLFELSECRRTGTVEEYSNASSLLPAIGSRVPRRRLFTGGLLPPLARRIHHPEALRRARQRRRWS